jgi:hypothetical protein
LEESGAAEREVIERFLYNMVNPERRAQIDDFAATETAVEAS